MSKNKILFIATEYAPGMIPFAANIINAVSREKSVETFAFLVNSGSKSFKPVVSLDDSHCFFYEYPASKLKKLVFKFYPYGIIHAINRIVKENDIDKIHLLTGDFSLDHMWLTPSLTRENIYYTVHDLHPHASNTMSGLGKLLHRHILRATRRLIRQTPNLTTCSVSQFEELKTKYPNKNISFTQFPSLVTNEIINGRQSVPELQGISDYILFFGSVDQYKGVDCLVEAYMKGNCKNECKLVVAGRGRLDLKGNTEIIWLNRFILDEEIGDLFRKAKFVVYPYRSITMSGVLSLAFYFRKRIICSDLDYFKQYKNESMLFFPVNDIDTLAKSLDQTVNSTSLSSENIYEHYFSEKQLQRSLLSFYGLN